METANAAPEVTTAEVAVTAVSVAGTNTPAVATTLLAMPLLSVSPKIYVPTPNGWVPAGACPTTHRPAVISRWEDDIIKDGFDGFNYQQ